MLVAGTRDTSSPLTVATEFARLRRDMPVASPVTTISSSLSGSRAIVIVMAFSVAATGTSSGGKPMRRTVSVMACAGAMIVKVPSSRASVPVVVPLIWICALPTGAPLLASTTLPVTVRVCASAEVLASTVAARTDNHLYFIGLLVGKTCVSGRCRGATARRPRW